MGCVRKDIAQQKKLFQTSYSKLDEKKSLMVWERWRRAVRMTEFTIMVMSAQSPG